MSEQSIIDEKNVRLAITLKTSELKRNQLSSLTYQHVEQAVLGKWKYQQVHSIHEAVNDIVHLTANDVVAYLSTEAIIQGSKMKLQDFEDLFGGKK